MRSPNVTEGKSCLLDYKGLCMDRIELLAPAGDYNCFLAAVNAGADAVYLSGEKFGARAYAKNFSKEELLKAIDYAHIFGRKVFMTVNTLLKDDEINELHDFLLPYYEAGIDGVIVQDMGVIAYIRRVFSDLPVHASTQLTITGLEGIKLLEKLGVKRTVLAREVSMEEIEYIHDNSNMEIETFVHGALCYSYSGKCLFSSLVGGRSGNRGRCAGSCRQPYNNNQYLLSTKDICCLSLIPDMIQAGICSLKIEGRMKSPEYVAGVTSVYRKYIDYYYEYIDKMPFADLKQKFFSGKEYIKDKELLTRLYTRGGNSEGYYYKNNGKDMISLSDASYKSDKGDIKASVKENIISEVSKKTLKAVIKIRPEENISIIINDVFYYEGVKADIAANRPLDIETISKQLNKTKDTEFEFTDIKYDVADNVFVRVSDLNELRREAINGYREYLLSCYRRNRPNTCVETVTRSNANVVNEKLLINCDIDNAKQLDTILSHEEIDGIYIPFSVLNDDNHLFKIKNSGKRIYLKFPSVIRHNFLQKNRDAIINCFEYIDGVLADSHEVIEFLLSEGFSKEIIGDIHIYALNREAEDAYRKMGVSKLTVPIELNKKELYRLGMKNAELMVYGYLPMMISAQCVNSTLNGCNRSKEVINLKDRRGAEFKAVNKCDTCLNIIYNNVPLSLQGEHEFVEKLAPESLRLCFTIESDDEIDEIIKYYIEYYKHNKNNSSVLFKENCYTKGHLNRGVL